MSISKLKAATLALMCATSLAAVAVPAKPGIIKMTQPDGTTIDVRLVGDERSHYTLSPDGYLLTPVNDTYFYATISEDGLVTPSAVRASDVALRSAKENSFLSTIDLTAQAAKMKARDAVAEQSRTLASPANFGMPARRPAKEASEGYPQGPGLFPGTHFPPFGEQKGLVILVEYTDVKFKLDDPSDYFTRMLNEPGFSSWGATGSAVDFFRESSSDLFRPQFDVYGPITLANSQAFYGGNNWSGDDQNPEKMAIEACQQLDPTVDFTEYDRDGDGYIDNVFIFYAGRGEASGGSANTVWPHAWNVTAATSTPYIFDGVQLDRYACSNEWESGRPDGVGTFVHEFSHVMGLPDLYATSYTSSFTPGAWSAMDYGPYNNSGMTPPLYSAFERYALGWIEPTEISGPMDVTLRPIGDNVCGIVKTDREDEYFLFENRQNTSWDTYIPGHGMLVWHIDYSAPVWNYNRVNNTPSHQYVDIEEADGTQNEYSRTGDSFPGTSEVTSFTAEGNPAFATWNGTPINLPLTGIAEADGVITFKVAGGREIALPTTVALPATDCTHTAFTANWQLVDGATSYMISLRKLPADPEGEPEVIYTNKIVGNASSFRVEDLEPETLYEYDVCVGSQLEYSAPSNVIVASTGRLPLNFVTPVAVEATDITETSFTANWEAVDDANDYLISLLEKVWGAPYRALCDFADGASKLPAGWTSSSGAGYANSAYSGEAVPSLRLSAAGDHLTTCNYPEAVRAISFWHRGSAASEPEDVINVMVKIGTSWEKLASFPVITDKGGKVNRIDEVPAGVSQVRLEYLRKSTKGALAIDDVIIEWGMTWEPVPVEGFEEGQPTGNVVSYTFTDLKPGTTYNYCVKATDGTLVSLTSNTVDITTAGQQSALESIAAESAAFTAQGRTLTALAPVTVFDIAGRQVALLPTGSSVTLPAGVYLIKSPSTVCKTILH